MFHLDPFRFIPVGVLGIWMGYLLLKTGSIFVPILAHVLNNSLAVLLSRDYIPFIGKIVEDGELPYWTIIPALILIYIIYLWVEKINTNYKIESGE